MQYNFCMENYIVFFIVNIIIDIGLLFSLKTFFKLSVKKTGLIFLEIFNIINLSVYFILKLESYQFILLKFAINLIIILLITDSYKFLDLLNLFLISIFLMFSYYGFFKFIYILICAITNNVFCKNMSYFAITIIVFLIFVYVFAVFIIISKIMKTKKIKALIQKVVFFAFGKHIEIMGLLDTGNILYDTKTKLPVIILNVKVLKNYLSQKDYQNITNEDYSSIAVDHYLRVITISKEEQEIPIIIPKYVIIKDGERVKREKCVLGLVNHDFENTNDYGCLLHRDLF